MKSRAQTNRFFRPMGWILGSVGLLLLLSDGLAFFAQQTLGQTSMATVLVALYVASWSYALALAGLFLGLAWWLMSRRRMRPARLAARRYVSAEPGNRHFAKPEMEASALLEDDVVVDGLEPTSAGHDGHRTNDLTRVA